MSSLSDLDKLLSVVENPTRRRILEALVREPHYPLQLSRELGMSQQAIMKHLHLLEEYNLVRSFPEESDQGGPMRKRYFPTTKFTIIVDFGPGLFNAEFVQLALKGVEEAVRVEEGEHDLSEYVDKINSLRETITGVDNELEDIQARRSRLIEIKERALDEAGRLVEGQIEDYLTRRIIYEYIQRPELSPEQIAADLGLRDDVVQQTVRKLRQVN
ncbi:MAG TPA: helix-turn-helix domain-containing protein [Methanomassiliicoccales archaeon]|nr:helix-turn-helix domain-containing protein [Methanomassiliicoccales archaeon]